MAKTQGGVEKAMMFTGEVFYRKHQPAIRS
jgi:hypothetical protein